MWSGRTDKGLLTTPQLPRCLKFAPGLGQVVVARDLRRFWLAGKSRNIVADEMRVSDSGSKADDPGPAAMAEGGRSQVVLSKKIIRGGESWVNT